MARYIDSDNLLEKLHRMIDYCEKDRKVNAVSALFQVGDAIMDCKTADVEEVRHGKWVERVKIRKDEEVRLVHWQCSLCECFLGTNTANYCPNCGARMDGDEK